MMTKESNERMAMKEAKAREIKGIEFAIKSQMEDIENMKHTLDKMNDLLREARKEYATMAKAQEINGIEFAIKRQMEDIENMKSTIKDMNDLLSEARKEYAEL